MKILPLRLKARFRKSGLSKKDLKNLIFYLTLPILVIFFILYINHLSIFLILEIILIQFLISFLKYNKSTKIISLVLISSITLSVSYVIFNIATGLSPTKSLIISLIVFFVPNVLFYNSIASTIDDYVDASKNVKLHQSVIENYPHLFCRQHKTKTIFHELLNYPVVSCRIGKRCLSEKNLLTDIEKSVGLTGIIEDSKQIENKYYTTIYDHKTAYYTNADIDIWEIHNNEEIDDYNAVIDRTYRLMQNDLKRQVPLCEVIVRIYGNPKLSQSTQSLLKFNFLSVEYL
jgi:hypothetical protein